eukprot:TRINITY_DN42048_c0_g1_i1.p1 TRINITY_DN42048_c0_g1~~TRINITY_DN42048_c0_g1_i1.p1  ORF type:complete len:100 (-),score=10.80 TRINITY_DN42048_c0_g1_i1:102-401(-)
MNLVLIFSALSVVLCVPVQIPEDPLAGLPNQELFQPEKASEIPIDLGERRCDNFYNGHIPPCLLRPWVPPFSYSTMETDNGEYRRRKREENRVWHFNLA